MKRTIQMSLFVCLCLFLHGLASGAEFCVETASELKVALTAAQSNGEDDVIQMVQGTYTAEASYTAYPDSTCCQRPVLFSYVSSEGRGIALKGGYTQGCAARALNPSNTTLDAARQGEVFFIQQLAGGDVALEGLTIENSGDNQLFSQVTGVEISVYSSLTQTGNVTLTKNIFHKNGAVGAYVVTGATPPGQAGNITLIGNLFLSNGGARWGPGGLGVFSSYDVGQGGDITLVNNIFADNYVQYGDGSAMGLGTSGNIVLTNNTITGNSQTAVLIDHAETLYVYNNIIWGNQSGDIKLLDVGFSYGYNNNYSDLLGSYGYNGDENPAHRLGEWSASGGNLDVDPLFEAPVLNNYHLQRFSPLIDSGSADAPDLPETDFDGNPRSNGDPNVTGSNPDIGAYEYIRPSPPQQPTVVNPTSPEGIERAPVKVRMSGCETKVMETIVNLGHYRSAVDLYLAMGRPDGTYFLIDPQGQATSQWVPFRKGIITAHDLVARSEMIFDVAQGWLVQQGIWTVDWIIVPSTGAGIEGIDWATDPYEMGWVYFQVPVLPAEWKPVPVYVGGGTEGIPIEFGLVSAGSRNQVVAMGKWGGLYKYNRTFFTEGFEPLVFAETHVAVGCDGTVWGPWRLGTLLPDMTFEEAAVDTVPEPGLMQFSAGRGDNVWGVDAQQRIFRRQGDKWVQVEGELGWVSVGCDGTVWGVHPTSQIFRRDGDQWTEIPGELKQISVGAKDVVYGVHANGQIFKWLADRWVQVEGTLKQISAASDGTLWGVTRDLRLVRNTYVCEQY